MLMQLSVMGAVSEVVEVVGTVCDAGCSIFSQTVDRQRPPTAV